MKSKKMKSKEKVLVIPIIIMIITFFMLIVGATYAYFNVTTGASGSSSKVTMKTGGVGVSTLKTGNNLNLNLSLTDMMKKGKNVTYYATLDGTPSTSENSEVIGTAEVEGNETMNCSYKLEVKASGTNNMFTAFQNMSTKSTNQLILNVDGTDYDLFDISFPYNITGTLNNVTSEASKNIEASFRIVNRNDVDQSKLGGTDIVLSFAVINYECLIVG